MTKTYSQTRRIIILALTLYFLGTLSIMTHANAGKTLGEGFSVSSLGGHVYGSQGIGTWLSGIIRVGTSDTIDKKMPGVGIFENQLSPSDLEVASEIHRRLCEVGNATPAPGAERVEPMTIYSVACLKDGKETTYQGRLVDLPEDLSFTLNNFYLKSDKYLSDARPIVKLDVAVDSIVRQKEQLLVTVKFTNGGDLPMVTSAPQRWTGRWGESLLWITGRSADGSGDFNLDLSGLTPINASEFNNDRVTIPARNSVLLKFSVSANDKLKAGTYKADAKVFMSVSGEYPVSSMGKVDFHSDYKNPAIVRFDRDYPSTPAEWNEYESRKAKEVSSVRPGANVAEAGFYRAVSVFGPRAPFLTALKPGESAPKLNPNEWDQWEWEADLARPVKCAPGDACPREGRWTPRAANYRGYAQGDLIYSAHERHFRAGDRFPAVDVGDDAARSLYWEWLGA